jgi:hypothetical protein
MKEHYLDYLYHKIDTGFQDPQLYYLLKLSDIKLKIGKTILIYLPK